MFKLPISIITIILCIAKCSISFAALVDKVPVDLAFVPCKGAYALCYYAKCKLNTDGTADCGCILFNEADGYSFVNVNHIYPAELQAETLAACPNGMASCLHGEAPICHTMQSKLMSTFNTGEPLFKFAGAHACGKGKFANCMTALCEKKVAFDGSPITCKCRVRDGDFAIAKTSNSDCKLPVGMVWSGVPVSR